ncbi:S26 family signal peptidase [Haloarchaeobius sp. HRN-SO-5]|uniref:S26 family signal peptidase n=1 Tax=Haloarchaeobius sp. HRN-SO-5 TaxID=3446118 RepID=UPI003EB74298
MTGPGTDDESGVPSDADASQSSARTPNGGAVSGDVHSTRTGDGRTGRPDGPPVSGAADGSGEFDGPIDWFFNTDDSLVVTIRDVTSSVATVVVIGLVLFAVSGIWPPLVAVESGSMEPHMHKNDLVFIVDEDRFTSAAAIEGTGVVTHERAEATTGYWSFGDYGNVVIYQPDGSQARTPIIHRAMFYVEEGENWYDRANPDYLREGTDSCREVSNDACPAPYDGFITKGDNNQYYDQVGSQSSTVKPEWIQGKAKVRIPLLGWIRLQFAKFATVLATTGPVGIEALRLQLGLVTAGVGVVVSRRRGLL